MQVRIVAAAFAIVLGGGFVPAYGQLYKELMPTRNSHTDENQINRFYIGPFVFLVKNYFLFFPFNDGARPFDGSVCNRNQLSDFERGQCSNPKKSVPLRIPVTITDTAGKTHSFVSSVTLAYKEMFKFSDADLEAYARDYAGGLEHLLQYDTDTYVAMNLLPKPEQAKNMSPEQIHRGWYYMLAKGAQSPHRIGCSPGKKDGDFPNTVECGARIGFLTDQFPMDADGHYPYTLDFNFSGADIENAPAIQTAVVKAVLEFPRENAPEGWVRMQNEGNAKK